jgi:hypothetical protein
MIPPAGNNPSQIPLGTLVLSSIILCLSIAGLIMQSSGTPWISEAEYDDDDKVSYDAQDWEECCEEAADEVAEEAGYDTIGMIFTSLTPYFVLLIIFSAVLAVISLVPIPRNFKGSLSSILGLSLLTTGIFLSRKFAITLSYYFGEISNLWGSSAYSAEPNFHLHVMIYFGGLVGLFAIWAGWVIVSKNINSCNYLSPGLLKSRKFASGLLLIGMMVYLVSPIVPIYSSEFDTENGSDESQSSELVFPFELLMVDDVMSAADEVSDDENNLTAVSDSYSTAETLFLSLIWINLSILALISMAIFPRANKYFETITQINILSVGVIIPAIIFSILVYTGIPDIAEDRTYVVATSFNANWVLILASVLCAISWISMLVQSHIPWWASISHSNNQLPMKNFNHSMHQQNPIQQPVYENPQVYNQQPQMSENNPPIHWERKPGL